MAAMLSQYTTADGSTSGCRDCAIEEGISMVVLIISALVFLILPRSAERYNHDHSCISMGMLFLSSLSSQVLPRVPALPGRYKHLHQRISMDNARCLTAELSGITTSVGEYRGDTIAFVRVSQWVISFFSPRESLVLPRLVGRYDRNRLCISMARYRVSILKAADRTSYFVLIGELALTDSMSLNRK
jgi:hypothetical protein